MNERLKQLEKQAYVVKEYSQNYEYISGDTQWSETVFDREKFAELIVRETLDQVTEFSSLTKAYQAQGIDPEIDVTKEVLKNFGFTRFPRS